MHSDEQTRTDLVVIIDFHYSWFQVLHQDVPQELQADGLHLLLFQLDKNRKLY